MRHDSTVTLWRVGGPTIGETLGTRFNSARDSGGWGTGVYAFRDYRKARTNAERFGKPVHKLPNALDNPVEPTSRDESWGIHKFSIGLLKFANSNDPLAAAERMESDSAYFPTYERRGFAGTTVEEDLTEQARTTGLAGIWGLARDMVKAGLRATHEARQCVENSAPGRCSQPINRMLWQQGHDGIAPTDGAGGNSGDIGCVIFAERIEEVLGYRAGYTEPIDLETLVAAFSQT